MDGFLFDQKITKIVAEECERLQTKVQLNFANMKEFGVRMDKFEKKVEEAREKLIRVAKFDSAVLSFERKHDALQEECGKTNHALFEMRSQVSSSVTQLERRLQEAERSLKFVDKYVTHPEELVQGIVKVVTRLE